MSTSILFSSNRATPKFVHVVEPSHITFTDGYIRFNGAHTFKANVDELWLDEPNAIFFLSNRKKVFLTLMNGPYHFFIDSIGPFLEIYKDHPDALFIFDIGNIYEPDDKYFNFFLFALRQKEIDFRIINAKDTKVVADNFIIQKHMDGAHASPNLLYDFFKDFFDNSNQEPFRKVYVSRGFMPPRNYDNIVPGTSFNHDNRIDDEKVLEDFLSGLGFDIIRAETSFNTFKDQLQYFSEVKTLVSLTSGGITNSCFMRPGGTVVEFVTSMVTPMGSSDFIKDGKQGVEEALHHFYTQMSWAKGHNYIGLDNKTRNAESLIKKIKDSEFLRVVFGI